MSSAATRSRRYAGASTGVVALLLALLLAVPPATSAHRKFLQDDEDQNAGAEFVSSGGGESSSSSDEGEPQDGTPFGADSDDLATSWSKASPTRQVAAAADEEEEPRSASVVEEAQEEPQEQQLEGGGSIDEEQPPVPDDGLFDEESASQPFVTAVDPGKMKDVETETTEEEESNRTPKAAPRIKAKAAGSAAEAPAVEAPVEEGPAPAAAAPKSESSPSETTEASAAASPAAGSSAKHKNKSVKLLTKSDLIEEPEDVVELVNKVALYPSDCVPADTAVLVQVNYHHIPLFHAQVKNVIQHPCFMRRYVLLALDGKSMDECRKIQANGVELHCAKSEREYAAADIVPADSVGEEGKRAALTSEELKDILFDRWTVVANVLEATPNLKLWVFDADVVIFKVPTLELPDGCDFSTQLDKLDALGLGSINDYMAEYLGADYEDNVDEGDAADGYADAVTFEPDGLATDESGSDPLLGGYRHRHLLMNDASAPPTLSLVPHTDRENYSMNGGQVVLHNKPEVIAFLRAVGRRGEDSDDLDYLVMNHLMQRAAGKPWEAMTSCDLPETFSSACWGLAIEPFTFHANCVDFVEDKLKEMHNAVSLIASATSPSTGELTLAEGYPEGTARYCWDEGVMCKAKCEAGKLCAINYVDYFD